MNAGRTRGEIVLHPVALVALAVLLVNDHVLKGRGPEGLTGKLSDVAGMVFLPFLLVALWDVVLRRTPDGRVATVAAVSTATVFAAIKLVSPVRTVAALGAGAARAPLDVLTAAATGGSAITGPGRIAADPSAALAVVACVTVVLVVRRRTGAPPPHETGAQRPFRGARGLARHVPR